MNLLDVHDLSAQLGRRTVLHDVSLNVGKGEFIGLVGPNGAGKSTLLRALAGLVHHTGRVTFGGHDAGTFSARARARHLAFLPQERDIVWPIPVADIVMLGRTPHLPPFARWGAQDRQAAADAMQRMEVEAFAERPATELSGGEKARVLIARALAQETPILLADEPAAGLDPAHQIALMRLFRDLALEGRSVIASLHDLALAARWCSRIVLIDKGRIIIDAPPANALTRERLRTVYGVEAFFADQDGPVVLPLDLARPARREEQS